MKNIFLIICVCLFMGSCTSDPDATKKKPVNEDTSISDKTNKSKESRTRGGKEGKTKDSGQNVASFQKALNTTEEKAAQLVAILDESKKEKKSLKQKSGNSKDENARKQMKDEVASLTAETEKKIKAVLSPEEYAKYQSLNEGKEKKGSRDKAGGKDRGGKDRTAKDRGGKDKAGNDRTAKDRGAKDKKGGRDKKAGKERGNIDDQLARMKKNYNLTDEQTAQWGEILEEKQAAMEAISAKKGTSSKEDIKAERKKLVEETSSKIMAILNKEQADAYRAAIEKKGQKGKRNN